MTGTLALDIDGIVITGRPGDGAPWATGLEADLGLSLAWLQRAFFGPHWAGIVTGQKPMRPILEGLLPDGGAARFINYWFAQDARLNGALLKAVGDLRAKGWRVILVSNQESERAAHLWTGLGLRNHADEVYVSATLGYAKPDPRFFEAVCNKEGSCHFLDDDARNVEAARCVGWRAEHAAHPDEAVAVLRRLTER